MSESPDARPTSTTANGGPAEAFQKWKWMLPAIATGAMILKLTVVAHGNPSTIREILVTQGAGGWFTLALVALMPSVVGFLLFLQSAQLAEAIREGEALRGSVVALAIVLAVALVFAPATVLAAIGAIGLANVALGYLWGRRLKKRGKQLSVPTYHWKGHLLALAVLATLVTSLSPQPWMNPEKVGLSGGSTITAYVLDVTATGTKVMMADDRSVRIVTNPEIVERVICVEPGWWGSGRSVLALALWHSSPTPPQC